MANHPANLAFRFLLEILGWAAFAFWGWSWGGVWRWPLAIGVPLVTMVIWGVFRTPGDGPQKQGAPVAVHGIVRVAIELGFFGLAVVALFNAHANSRADIAAVVLAVLVTAHYILSWDRVLWLLLMRAASRPPDEELLDPPA